MFQNKNGFTLIEILITIAIFTIILGIAVISMKSFNNTVNLDNAGKIIGTNIKLAKMNSIGALNDSNHGVHFESNYIVVFEGSAFDVGDSANKVVNLPDNVEIYAGDGSDLIFGRLTGVTDNFGTIGIRLINNPTETRQIVINEEGQIDYAPFPTSSTFPITNARHVHYELKWDIKNSTILRFEQIISGTPTINNIDATAYFNIDKTEFDWNGETITGSSQTARIHGWLDANNHTILCVILDQTEEHILNIYFDDGITEKKITTYTYIAGDGTVSVTPDSSYVLGATTIK